MILVESNIARLNAIIPKRCQLLTIHVHLNKVVTLEGKKICLNFSLNDNHSINQSINQSINHSLNQSIDSVMQSINQSINQSIFHLEK